MVSDVDADGHLVARKVSRDLVDADRLRHEAAVLVTARHPGVVEFVGCDEVGDGNVALTTAFVGTHSLDTLPSITIERAAGLVAALAEIVADLHDVGIVHGRIEPSHVLIGNGGRPMLCGFAGGGRIGTTPPPGSTATPGFCDPAATDGATLTPELDVYGLGALLRALVLDPSADVEPIPDRRLSVGRLRPRWSGYQRRALLTLADQATDDAPLRRPPARRLASDILHCVPSATTEETVDPFAGLRSALDDPERPRRQRRWGAYGAIAAGIVLVVLALTEMRGEPSVAVTRSLATTTTSTLLPATSSTSTIEMHPAGTVTYGGKQFTVGMGADVVVQGDWDCDGTPTIALLRPTTGALFVFDTWSDATHDVTVSPTTYIDPGATVRAIHTGGCDSLIVMHPDGSEEEVTL